MNTQFYNKKKLTIFTLFCCLIATSKYSNTIPNIKDKTVQYALLRVVPGTLLATHGVINIAKGIDGTVDKHESNQRKLIDLLITLYGASLLTIGLNSLDIIRISFDKGWKISQGNNLKMLISLIGYARDPINNL